jgi:hypothetical protein
VAFLRILFLAVALTAAAGAGLYLMTGERRYLRWAVLAFKLGVAAGLLFFAVLLVERALA